MKDLSHHRNHLLKKVIRQASNEEGSVKSIGKPLKFRSDLEVPYWEPINESEKKLKEEKNTLRNLARKSRVAKVKKERKVLQY
jgi:hypothetical protein